MLKDDQGKTWPEGAAFIVKSGTRDPQAKRGKPQAEGRKNNQAHDK